MTPEQADYARVESCSTQYPTLVYMSIDGVIRRTRCTTLAEALRGFRSSNRAVCIARNGVIMVQRHDKMSPR